MYGCSDCAFVFTRFPVSVYYIRKIMFYGAIDMTAQTTRAKIAIGYRIGHLRVEEIRQKECSLFHVAAFIL